MPDILELGDNPNTENIIRSSTLGRQENGDYVTESRHVSDLDHVAYDLVTELSLQALGRLILELSANFALRSLSNPIILK